MGKRLLGFLRLGFLSFFFGPTLFHDLARPAQGQRVRRHIFGDAGGSGDIGAFSDADRGDQNAVAAYEYAVFDDGLVLVYAVIVAGNGTGADIDFFADFRVTQVTEMVGFRAFAEAAFLQFHEISHVGVFTDFAAWA